MFDQSNSVGVPSTLDGVLSITKEPADNELSFDPSRSVVYSDNRTGIILGSTVDSTLLNCEAMRSGTFNSLLPVVSWIKDGEVILNSTGNSSFHISSFSESDAGVYQCIFTDADGTAEVVTTIPFRLDTGLQYFFCTYYSRNFSKVNFANFPVSAIGENLNHKPFCAYAQ